MPQSVLALREFCKPSQSVPYLSLLSICPYSFLCLVILNFIRTIYDCCFQHKSKKHIRKTKVLKNMVSKQSVASRAHPKYHPEAHFKVLSFTLCSTPNPFTCSDTSSTPPQRKMNRRNCLRFLVATRTASPRPKKVPKQPRRPRISISHRCGFVKINTGG